MLIAYSAKDSNGRVGKESDSAMKINMIVVRHDGVCVWYPNLMSVSYCPIDVQWFPFDVQECSLDYELWSSNTTEVNLTAAASNAVRPKSHANGEWEIFGKIS
jgi:Neurotransmitter-gated ion-channel ligand binding domain